MAKLFYPFTVLSLLFLTPSFGQIDVLLQTGNHGKVTKIEIHPSQNIFLSADSENNIVIWDLSLRKQFSAYKPIEKINDACFINDSVYALAIGKTIEFWDFVHQELIATSSFDNPVKQVQNYDKEVVVLTDGIKKSDNWQSNEYSDIIKGNISLFKKSENGKFIAYQNSDIIEVLDLTSNKIALSVNDQAEYLHLSESGDYFAACHDKSSLSVYSVPAQKKTALLANTRSWNKYEIVNFYKDFAVTGDDQDIVTIFQLRNGRIIDQFKNKTGTVKSLDLDTDKKILLIGGEEGTINYYDLSTHEQLSTFQSISPDINSIRFISNETIILTDNNAQIKRWNLKTHEVETISIEPKGLDKVRQIDFETHLLSDSSGYTTKKINQFGKNDEKKISHYDIKFSFIDGEVKLKKRKKMPAQADQLGGLNEKYSDNLFSYEIEENQKLITLERGVRFNCSATSPNGNNILAAASDGFLYWIDKNDGEVLLKMCSPDKSSFFYITPENHYFASKNALSFLSARFKNTLMGFEQIDLLYNRPDKVLAQFDFNGKEYIELLNKAYKKRLQKLGIKENAVTNLSDLPSLSVNLNSIPLQTAQKNWKILVESSSKTASLKAIHLLVNGVPVGGKEGFLIEGNKAKEEIDLILSEGKNKIQIYVENENGLKSIRKETNVKLNAKNTKDLYLLSIGSGTFKDESFNLNFAEKDARDIAESFQGNTIFKNIHERKITGKDVKIETIKKAIEDLKKADVDDVIIVFFAGHGVLDHELDYFLSTHEMNFQEPSENGLRFDDLEKMLGDLKCRQKILFIDACHSGELDKDEVEFTSNEVQQEEELIEFRSGTSTIGLVGGRSIFELSKNLFVDLRENNGVVIISSAGAAEYALEGSEWKNGAFTYCILTGLNNLKADQNGDKKVTLNELQSYLFKSVTELTKGKQTPTSRVEILEQDYRLW